MRKEVKLGFAIGGVLLSVLIIYVLVISGGEDQPQPVELSIDDTESTQVKPETPEEQTRDPFHDPIADASAPTAAPVPPPPATEDKWSVLHTGELPKLMTTTPVPAPAVPAPLAADANTPAQPAVDAPPLVASNVPASVAVGAAPATMPAQQPAIETPAAARTHTVRSGENFATIAAAVYGNSSYYPHLIRANPTLDPRKLRPGMVINLPPVNEVRVTGSSSAAASSAAPASLDASSEYRVAPGDSLYKISLKLYGKADRIDKLYELNKSTIGPNPQALKVGMVLKLPETPTAGAAR